MRSVLIALLSLLVALPTQADSWCNFSINYIGNKAMGGMHLRGYNTEYGAPHDHFRLSKAADDCELKVYAQAERSGPSRWVACRDFQHLQYQPQEGAASVESYYGTAVSLIGSEYWLLQILAHQNDMHQLITVEGKTLWWPVAERDRGQERFATLERRGSGLYVAETTSAQVYATPDLTDPMPERSFHGDAQYAFFEKLLPGFSADEEYVRYLTDYRWRNQLWHYIDYLEKQVDYLTRHPDRKKPLWGPDEERIDASEGQTYLKASDAFSIGYEVHELVTADDGSQWHRASERIMAHVRLKPIAEEMQDQFDNDSHDHRGKRADTLYSDPIREVYIPHRAADGTVLNVFTSDHYCD